jgi:hypothetical protein
VTAEGVYVESVNVDDVVRFERQVWRVAEVSLFGRDEVGLMLVGVDAGDRLTVNVRGGEIIELMSRGGHQEASRRTSTS